MGTITFNTETLTDTPVVTTTETIVATLSGIGTPRRTNVTARGRVDITTGTGTTAVTLRIRRGTAITDTLIGEANAEQVTAAAGSTESHEVEARDAGVDLAGATYILTVQQTAATANGSVLNADLHVAMPD